MASVGTKIQLLLESSRSVLRDCVIENGAIVAANTDKNYYPKNANDYRKVWPRDAAFMIYAMRILGDDPSEIFSEWLLQRAEHFKEQGLFFRYYVTNGAVGWSDLSFQPDQAGALLWSLSSIGDRSEAVNQAVKTTANALCRTWDNDHFTVETCDLWEHVRSDETHGSFTYALAAGAVGLLAASKLGFEESHTWFKTASQMRQQILEDDSANYFCRLTDNSTNVDSSLIGLVWPFKVIDDKEKLFRTIEEIEQRLATTGGLLRFSDDVYDGVNKLGLHINNGAGAWPLLTCWYAIALNELGKQDQARQIFEGLVENLTGIYIPEQFFTDEREGVKPLGWSHAMFVIACQKLGYL